MSPHPAGIPQRVALARLEAVYAKLPRLDCKGLCTVSCTGDFEVLWPERARIRKAAGDVPRQVEGRCSLLVEGRCSAHAERPFICRAWGAVETMPCTHDCLADGERELTFREFLELQVEAYEAVGHPHAAKLRAALDDDEAMRQLEFIARQGQELSFDCPGCAARVAGHVGDVFTCPGCGAAYRAVP